MSAIQNPVVGRSIAALLFTCITWLASTDRRHRRRHDVCATRATRRVFRNMLEGMQEVVSGSGLSGTLFCDP
jgi:hypothetical protein